MSRPYQLYGYWRSSASWRIRWALALKKVPFDQVPVNLLKGEHRTETHLKVNPAGLVPVLVTPQGERLVQSLAILEYLEELFPNPALYGNSPQDRVQIRSLCEIINADTAPLQVPRVQKRHSSDPDEQSRWAQDWIRAGLKTFNEQRRSGDLYSAAQHLSAADLLLVPQIYNAIRYKIDVASEFPELMRIYDLCLSDDTAVRASPEQQLDAPH